MSCFQAVLFESIDVVFIVQLVAIFRHGLTSCPCVSRCADGVITLLLVLSAAIAEGQVKSTFEDMVRGGAVVEVSVELNTFEEEAMIDTFAKKAKYSDKGVIKVGALGLVR